MTKPVPFENLIQHLLNESHQLELIWQIGILLACIIVSWGLMRLITPHLTHENASWRVGQEAMQRLGQPLIGFILIVLARSVFQEWYQAHLLNIVIPLLGALVLVRLLVYMLRYVFNNNEALKIWERFIGWIIWLGFALHITGLLPRIMLALDAISFESGSRHFSLLLLLKALTVIVIAMLAALWLAQLIEARLMRLTSMDPSLRLALIKALRTLLLITGILVALPAVGIDITVLSVFGGALGVGLGFGLQKVASNYISGFIILLDRSIRPGDMITVDTRYGEVSQLKTRYTLLRAQDGTEVIIPNETLITSTVVNHSFTKRDVRMSIPIQVGYDSDLEVVFDIMITAAKNHTRVLASETTLPRVLINGFGDNGINLELIVWLNDPEEGQGNLRSDLYLSIWHAFKAANISLPYPHRNVQIIKDVNKL